MAPKPKAKSTPAKRKLVESEWEKQKSTQKIAKRTPATVNIDEVVSQTLRDNFKGWEYHSTDVKTVNGVTLRQQLQKDKVLWLSDRKSIVMGKFYYRRLKVAYSEIEKLIAQLVPKEKGVTPAALKEHCTAALGQPPKYGGVTSYLQKKKAGTLSEQEVCCLLRCLLQITPGASNAQLKFGLDVLRGLARCGAKDQYPELFHIVFDKMDEIMAAAAVKVVAAKQGPKDFTEKYEGVWQLVMDATMVTKLLDMAEGATASEFQKELFEITDDSVTGAYLFGYLARPLVRKLTLDHIAKGLSNLDKKRVVSSDDFNDEMGAVMGKIEELPGVERLNGKEALTLLYRGWSLEVDVVGWVGMVEWSFHCWLRSRGAQSESVDLLPAEETLAVEETTLVSEIESSLLVDSKQSRAYLSKLLASVGPHEALTAEALMHQQRNTLYANDPFVGVEIGFVRLFATPDGQKQLEEKFLNECMPEKTKMLSLDDAMSAAVELLDSDVKHLASASAMGSLKAALDQLKRMHRGEAPMKVENGSEFHTKFFQSLIWFYSFASDGAEDASETKQEIDINAGDAERRGVDGLRLLVAHMSTKDMAKVQWSQLVPFQVYRAFVPKELDSKVAGMLKKWGEAQSSKGQSRSSARGKGKTALSSTAAESKKTSSALFDFD